MNAVVTSTGRRAIAESSISGVLTVVCGLACLAASSSAQCTNPWSTVAGGADGPVWAATALPNGDFIVGGNFATIGGTAANRIARWNGTTFVALGSGIFSFNPAASVRSLLPLPNGDILAGGFFHLSGFSYNLARWNGATWSAFGGGLADGVWALVRLPNGDIVAGSGPGVSGCIARWNGTTWTQLGSGLDLEVYALAVLPGGDLVAGGRFTTAGGVAANGIARWNGSAWSAMGAGVGAPMLGSEPEVRALAVLPNGDLVAGGDFTMAGGQPANGIALWNGSSWSTLGTGMSGPVYALEVLPNASIAAAGIFSTAGGIPATCIARWNGSSWSAFGGGAFGQVQTVRWSSSLGLAVGGQFSVVDGLSSPRIARLTTSCPAAAAATGLGCPSSGGSNTLVADAPPWVDATLRATGTGLPTNALVLTVWGFTSFAQGLVPLTLAFGQAGPGCDLLVAPDILGLQATSTGTAQSQIFVPNVPPLVGMNFYHQMIPIELDMVGASVAVTATNALQLTAGMF